MKEGCARQLRAQQAEMAELQNLLTHMMLNSDADA